MDEDKCAVAECKQLKVEGIPWCLYHSCGVKGCVRFSVHLGLHIDKNNRYF